MDGAFGPNDSTERLSRRSMVGRLAEDIMDDAAIDQISRSVNRLMSRRATLGTLAGGGLAVLHGMGFAADAKRRKRRKHHHPKKCTTFRAPCATNKECCNSDVTNCDVTTSSSSKVCCFSSGAPFCTNDAECCGADAVCRHGVCTEG